MLRVARRPVHIEGGSACPACFLRALSDGSSSSTLTMEPRLRPELLRRRSLLPTAPTSDSSPSSMLPQHTPPEWTGRSKSPSGSRRIPTEAEFRKRMANLAPAPARETDSLEASAVFAFKKPFPPNDSADHVGGEQAEIAEARSRLPSRPQSQRIYDAYSLFGKHNLSDEIVVPYMTRKGLERRLGGRISLRPAMNILNRVANVVLGHKEATARFAQAIEYEEIEAHALLAVARLPMPSRLGRAIQAKLYEAAWNNGSENGSPYAGYRLATLRAYDHDAAARDEDEKYGNMYLARRQAGAVLSALMTKGDILGVQGFAVWNIYDYFYEEKDKATRERLKGIIHKRLTEAAEKNSRSAWLYLGWLYDRGEVFDLNPKKALECYQRGAELGDLESRYRVGMAYLSGQWHEDKQSAMKAALEQFESGCGWPQAAYEAGSRYLLADGSDIPGHIALFGTTPSDEKAARYFSMAADNDHVPSMMALAEMLAKGRGGGLPGNRGTWMDQATTLYNMAHEWIRPFASVSAEKNRTLLHIERRLEEIRDPNSLLTDRLKQRHQALAARRQETGLRIPAPDWLRNEALEEKDFDLGSRLQARRPSRTEDFQFKFHSSSSNGVGTESGLSKESIPEALSDGSDKPLADPSFPPRLTVPDARMFKPPLSKAATP